MESIEFQVVARTVIIDVAIMKYPATGNYHTYKEAYNINQHNEKVFAIGDKQHTSCSHPSISYAATSVFCTVISHVTFSNADKKEYSM